MRRFMLHSSVAALVLLAPLPLAAETAEAAAPAEAPAAATLPAITVARVESRHMVEHVIATGFVNPVQQINVQPLIEGQPIDRLLADVGDMVAADQVLAVLSDKALLLRRAQTLASRAAAEATIAQAEAQMLEAQASADEAERVAERTRKLRDQGSATQAAADAASATAIAATAGVSVARQSLAAARAQLDVIDAQLASLDLELTRTEVRAPFAGRISSRNAVIGAIASAAGAPMFVIEKDGALELWADVAEADIQRLQEGQGAQLRGVGMDTALPGRLRLVEPVIDSATRLGRARISVDDKAGLRAGMYLEADITVAERDALAVPVTAVGREGGRQTVLRVAGDTVEQVEVTLGIREGGWVEVVSGLAAGDQIVAKAGSFVRPGDRINPVLDDATQ